MPSRSNRPGRSNNTSSAPEANCASSTFTSLPSPRVNGVSRRAASRPPASKPGERGAATVTRCPSCRRAFTRAAAESQASVSRTYGASSARASKISIARASTTTSFEWLRLVRLLPFAPEMDELVSKAQVLHEALPYIRRFQNRTFVVKYGGHAMIDETLKQSFARDVCLLRYVGIKVVVVHGGGPQINQMLDRVGIASTFSGGLRVTDDATMDVVEMVLGGGVNQEIVGMICQHGGRAVGLSGKDDRFMRGKRLEKVAVKDEQGERVLVDLGRVGEVSHVDAGIVENLIGSGFIPVIAPIAVDADGHSLNVNADTAAGSIASALSAAKLVLMTDVDGVKTAKGERLSSLGSAEAEEMIESGVISGGMIPKVRCALDAVNGGVEKVHIIDGRRLHALLLEIFTDSGVGTEIRRGKV